MSNTDYLLEEIKTIKNLADIALLVYQMNRKELMATITEVLYQHIQDTVLEHYTGKEEK